MGRVEFSYAWRGGEYSGGLVGHDPVCNNFCTIGGTGLLEAVDHFFTSHFICNEGLEKANEAGGIEEGIDLIFENEGAA